MTDDRAVILTDEELDRILEWYALTDSEYGPLDSEDEELRDKLRAARGDAA